MRRNIVRVVAAVALLAMVGHLVMETGMPIYRTFTDAQAHPGLDWWVGRACSVLLQTAIIILLTTIAVRNPRKE